MDLCTVKHSFSELINVMNPWTQSHFVMWLDIKVAEYKVYGKMVLDNKSVTTPEWLRNKNLGFDTEMASGQTSKDQTSDSVEITSTGPREQQRYSSTQQQGKDSRIAHNKNTSRVDSSANEIDRSRRETNVVDLSNYSDSQTHVSRTSSSEGSYNPRQAVSSLDKTSQGPLSSGHSASGVRSSDESRVSLDRQHVSHSDFTRGSEHNVSGTKTHSLSYTPDRSTSDYIQKSHTDHHSGAGHQSNNTSTFLNPFPSSNLHMSADVASNFTKLVTNRHFGTETHSKTQFEHPNVSSDVDMTPIKIEILDEDSEDSSPMDSHTYKKSLPDFGRTFATSSRRTSSSSVPTNQQITSPNILGSDILSQGQGHLPNLMTFGDYQNALSQPVPVSMYMTSSQSAEPQVSLATASDDNTEGSGEHETESTENTEQSWKHKKWQYIESLRGSSDNLNPKVQSRIMQRTKVFPDPFPVERLTYGNKARDMISSGVITRPAKMQFLDTVFNEIVKYTGLYPTPTQKMEVAKAIVNSFPKLNVRSKDSHISPADSWFVVLNDKFRNERRGLNNQSYQSQHMRQRALLTVRRAQAHMYNMASMSRSSAGGFSGVIKSQPDKEENDDT
ncbi:uncharacterized protein LOC110447978 [Mizuhopecten yessoensis]|uniref:BEN domain-containing protein n=1 Tax=Mizuhopecten yessoensis TaxID=6573 RepID=A0A210QU69_MIZYE|nr:uncharacterized protein LOC110447978 [Mizuhopecten yessoensis]OWF52280.1 hypothetical protein KP79_PYT04119 [Mizuhopecten yessoensis]